MGQEGFNLFLASERRIRFTMQSMILKIMKFDLLTVSSETIAQSKLNLSTDVRRLMIRSIFSILYRLSHTYTLAHYSFLKFCLMYP